MLTATFHRTLLLLLVALLLSLVSACKQPKAETGFRIGFSQCCDDPWRDVMNGEMARELLLHPEIDFRMKVANNNSSLQTQQIDSLVASGIDLLLVSPNEAEPLTPIIERIYQAGIPVVLIDRTTSSDLYTAYLGADNYEIGRTAGQYLANVLAPDSANIIEILLPKVISPSVDRHRGFRDALREHPSLEVVAQIESKGGLQDVYDQLPTLLAAQPEVDVIFGHTDLLAETAFKVAHSLKRTEGIQFIGIDGIPGTGRGIQAVEDGILDASMLYPTGGSEAIRLALAILNDLPYEKGNTLETIVIDESNARILHNQMKKVFSLQESIDEQVSTLESLRVSNRNQRILLLVLLASLLLAIVLGVFLWRSLLAQRRAFKALEEKNAEILAHEQQIVQMSEEVERATQAKVDFFTHISHEFRTPLTLILGFAEDLAATSGIQPALQQSSYHIRQNAFRLLRLVNQLLDFRKAESEQMPLRVAEHDLVAFVRDIMEAYSKIADAQQVDFQLLTRHEQLPLWFDTDMLDKVLFNLLSNAFKFTPEGGRIHVSLAVDNFAQQVKLTVEDSGPGMRAEELEHVFQAFYQGSQQRQAGTGLGLALSKLLVERHYGHISVQSAPGRGSRFQVSLPLGKQHFTAEEILSAAGSHTHRHEAYTLPLIRLESDLGADDLTATTADQQLLLIEDNHDLQHFLRHKLSATYQLEVATEGPEGLQKALDLVPDLIICDINLPGMSGLQITTRLKADLRTSHIPILLLSSRSTPEQQIEGIQTGADAYVVKPFNVAVLQAKIRSLLRNRQQLRESFGHPLQTETVALPEIAEQASPIDRQFIQQFATYIDQHHNRQDFQVADLCQEFGLSRSQLYRKVKALLGESISSYIESVRLQKAETLLLTTEQSVADIAYDVGYSSPDYFSTVFKSKYGLTPSAFRKQ